METGYSEQQEAFRRSVRHCLQEGGGTAFTRARWDASPAVDGDRWQRLSMLGVTGLLAPESAGGSGGDMTDMGVVMEELGRAVQPDPVWASCVGATSAAIACARHDLVEALAQGAQTATLALAEPGRRFAAWRQPGVRVANGRLSGTKSEVPDAIGAAYLFVSTDDGAFLVAADAPGLSVEPAPTFDGSRRFATVHFRDTPGERLGDNALLCHAVDRMLVALCTDGLGAADRVLEMSVAYVCERRQFGQPVGAFQAVQHLCADMLQQIEVGRAGLHHALWAVDAADPDEAHRAAVMCKAYMSEVLPQIGAAAIQVHGGAGFTWEYDVHLYYKRLLSMQATWGDAAHWLEELARLVIDGAAPPIVPD